MAGLVKDPRTPSRRLTTWVLASASVAGLWAITVVQPVLDLLGRAPEFFVAHRSDALDLLTYIAMAVFVPPLAAGAGLFACGLVGPRSQRAASACLVGGLAAALGVQVAYRAGAGTWPLSAAVALVVGVAAGWLWLSARFVRVAGALLSVALIVVPAAFLSSRGVRPLLRAGPTRQVARAQSQLAPVVFLVFDELPLASLLDRAGALHAGRYPHLAALAADGVWFRNATSRSDYTRWALPALLTGRDPRPEAVPTPADFPDTLFSLLAPTHGMRVDEPLTALCPASLCGRTVDPYWVRAGRVFDDVRVLVQHVLLPPDLRTALPPVDRGWARFDGGSDDWESYFRRARTVNDRDEALAFVEGISRTDRQPMLYFMHSMLTHQPPRWLPSGQAIDWYVPPQGPDANLVWPNEAWPVEEFQQGHLLQVGLADTVIGRLVARLKALGLYDRALIVVTADHGASFMPGGRMRSLTGWNGGEILPVPLIVKPPAGRQVLPPGTVSDRNVESVDVVPTIADTLGITVPWRVDGTSALGAAPERPVKIAWFGKSRYPAGDLAEELRAVNARNVARFGDGVWPAPNPPGLGRLLGKSVADLRPMTLTGSWRVLLANPLALDDIDPAAPSLPVLIRGVVAPPAGQDKAAVHLAVALNGEVVATTRTWSSGGYFRALLPPARLRRGKNDVQLYVADAGTGSLTGPITFQRALPRGRDLLFDSQDGYEVFYDGFYHVEQAGDTRFHWTDGAAGIRLPMDPAFPYQTLSVHVLFASRPDLPLTIVVNGCRLTSEPIGSGPWSKDFDLAPCAPAGSTIEIRFESETIQPGGSDRRRLGVALTRVVLR